MKGFKFFSFTMIVVLMFGMVLVGCSSSSSNNAGKSGSDNGSDSDEKVTISFANWVSAEDATKDNMKKVISEFEDKNPNIKVKNVPIPFDNMRQQLLTQVSGGNPPDVMMLSGPWSEELGAKGALIDMSKVADDDYLKDNYEGALDAGTYEDTLYAVPFELTPHGFWYNKDLMKKAGLDPKEPPETMDELNDQIDQIRDKLGKDIYPIGIDTSKVDYALVGFWPWFYSHGAKPLYDDEINFDTSEVQDALSWMRDLAKNKDTPVGQQIKEERELMAKDKIVFKLDGPYFKGILRDLNSDLEGDAFSDKFGVTTVPKGKNGKSETLADIHQLGISTASKHQDAAWKFIKFLASSEESIKDYQLPYGALPPLKSDDEKYSDQLDDEVNQTYVNDILSTEISGPYGPKFGDAQQVIINAMQSAVYKKDKTITQITKESEKKLEQIYGK